MEYVKVIYPTTRQVLVDGQPSGNTNVVLLVEEGTHVFGVSGDPRTVQIEVTGTSGEFPLRITDFQAEPS
jgi:hypothetical protein